MILACFGNSITEGYMVPPHSSWPSILERNSNIKTLNLGISGNTTIDAIRRLDSILELQYDAVFVELGINDFFMGIPLQSTQKNLEFICQTFLDAKKVVFLAGFTFRDQGSQKWEQMYQELSNKLSVPLYPDIFKGLDSDDRFFLPDGVHPNAEGYKIIAQNILSFLLKNLENSILNQ